MKDIEITRPLHLDSSETVALDTHSFLNILNVVNLELSCLADLCGLEHELQDSIQCIMSTAHDLSDPDVAYQRIAGLHEDIAAIKQQVADLLATKPEMRDSAPVQEALENLESIFTILHQRINDLQMHMHDRGNWKTFKIAQVINDFQQVFGAIEKNSKGRFRIISNIAAQQSKDYYVDFKVHSTEDPWISMPPVLIDVIRDLLANARKYTKPGGRISAGVWSDEHQLCIGVEDSGCGIPEQEIESVIDYGQRASNVLQRRTMGGGLGLTKAYVICKQFGGRFWIRSELNRGTRIRMVIPKAPHQAGDCHAL
ncbi:sensor histidine kinase [Rhabdochromatium marinum]|uniref:sensor histidine kinase n=1 Tax=Rhabdochromatium marinum TaxID=48729 RepID=UPI0019054BB8|nr:sensor histidine kinase [Rhabdochromatium marinum]MBK1648385.1 hypothetical protein [Rhabdochromatium marinum]